MKRRDLLTLLGGAAALWPLAGAAQQPKIPTIGVLAVGDPTPFLSLFREGLRDRGYVEGRNIQLEVRSAGGKEDLLSDLAAELTRRNVDVIVAILTPAVRAAKRATQTIPIVMAMAGAPVETGLIASIARPGGNITGLSATSAELGGKRVELIYETLPSVRRIAVLANATDAFTKPFVDEIERAGRTIGLQIRPIMVTGSSEFEAAFAAMDKERADAVIMQASIPAKPAIELALKHRIPPFSTTRLSVVEAGALMSYSARFSDAYREAAVYVDKILKGAKPADLPVQQPTRFELVINLQTAKALGLTIPPSILARADEVIE